MLLLTEKVRKNKSFDEVIDDSTEEFKGFNPENLFPHVDENNKILLNKHFRGLVKACEELIKLAVLKVNGEIIEVETKTYESTISAALTFSHQKEVFTGYFDSEQEPIKMLKKEVFWLKTPYVEDDYMFLLLQYGYYALIILNPTYKNRFRVVFTLWKQSIELKCCGSFYFNDELQEHKKYFVFWENNLFLIDPIMGTAYKLINENLNRRKYSMVSVIGFEKQYINGVECIIAITNTDEKIVLQENYKIVGEYTQIVKNNKHAEKSKSIEQALNEGRKPPKLLKYVNINLGYAFGKNNHIKLHQLNMLLFYGLDVMKFGLLLDNSIFNVDHKIDDLEFSEYNKLENLQIITQYANDIKKKKTLKNQPIPNYFSFEQYFSKTLKKAYDIQENYNYRANM